jgi:type II secretory pathway pseudopilin PulG
LTEVVVSLALLALALSMFLGTFVQATRSAVTANNRLAAIHNARLGLENLLSKAYASTELNVGARAYGVNGVTNYYSVVIVTQTPGIVVKNIFITNRWVNPLTQRTSTIDLAVSMSEEFHK